MDQTTWIFIGTLATALSAATFYTDIEDILGGFVAMVAWAYWAIAAFNVEIVTEAGIVMRRTYEPLALFGAGMAAIMLLVLLAGTASLLDPRDVQLMDEGRP